MEIVLQALDVDRARARHAEREPALLIDAAPGRARVAEVHLQRGGGVVEDPDERPRDVLREERREVRRDRHPVVMVDAEPHGPTMVTGAAGAAELDSGP